MINEKKVCNLCEQAKGLPGPERSFAYCSFVILYSVALGILFCVGWILATNYSFDKSGMATLAVMAATSFAFSFYGWRDYGKDIWSLGVKGRYEFAYRDREKVFHRHAQRPDPIGDYNPGEPILQIRVGGWRKRSRIFNCLQAERNWTLYSWTGQDLQLRDRRNKGIDLLEAKTALSVVSLRGSVEQAVVEGIYAEESLGKACAGMVDIVMESFLEKSSKKSEPAKRIRLKLQRLLARVLKGQIMSNLVAMRPEILKIDGWEKLQREFVESD